MRLYSWGANSYGQLSHGCQSEQCITPTQVSSSLPFDGVSAVAAGGGHSLVLDTYGNVLGSGSNNYGQLAHLKNNSTIFLPIHTLQEFKILQIECGWESSFAITDLETLLVWGSNKYAQLGFSKEQGTSSQHPVIMEIQRVCQVSAGLRHTAILTTDGHVFVTGVGNKGQLGLKNLGDDSPVKATDSFVKVAGLDNVKQVACGQHHSLALTHDGQLLGWGDNSRGQLGSGDKCFPTPRHIMSVNPAATIHAGWTHSAVLSEGRVRSWGRNTYNQLGHSCEEESVSEPRNVSELETVRQLSLGSEHNLVLLDDGQVWSWGWNEHGNCGTGTVDNIPVPVRVNVPYPASLVCAGAGHSLALCPT